MKVTMDILMQKRSAILDCAKRYGAGKIRVFGSVARGDTGELSDVDFLVSFAPERSLLEHGALIMDLRDLLQCEVDVISENGMRPRFRDRILKDAIPL